MPTLLIVEDDEDIRYLLGMTLRAEGFDVIEAGSGEAALELVADADLMLLDIRLPGIDGFEVLEHLPPQWGGRVVAMSAHASGGTEKRALAAGCVDYVAKPFDAEDVSQRLWRQVAPGSGG